MVGTRFIERHEQRTLPARGPSFPRLTVHDTFMASRQPGNQRDTVDLWIHILRLLHLCR